MKKIMWLLSLVPLIITAAALQFLPESVPMHYNMAGQIDRWGSKYENLIFPQKANSPVKAIRQSFPLYNALFKR